MNLERLRSVLTLPSGRPAVGPIGLDLGHRRLSLVQLERDEEGARICAAASTTYPAGLQAVLDSPASLRSLIERGMKGQRFRGRKVVAAIPEKRVKLMLVSYETGGHRSEPELILSLVEERIQESLEDCVVDYFPIRNAGKPNEGSALVAIAREDRVVGYLESLRRARLTVEALEISPVAVRRLVTWLTPGGAHENVLVLELGVDRSHLTVLWGRRLILYREIAFSESSGIERIMKSLGMAMEAAQKLLSDYGVLAGVDQEPNGTSGSIRQTVLEILRPEFNSVAEQVGNALVYTAPRTRGDTVDFVYLLGPVARWPGVDKVLQAMLSMPVRTLDPATILPGAGSDEWTDGSPTSCLAVAAGLALRGASPDE